MHFANLNPTDKTTLVSEQTVAVRQAVQRIDEFAVQFKSMAFATVLTLNRV